MKKSKSIHKNLKIAETNEEIKDSQFRDFFNQIQEDSKKVKVDTSQIENKIKELTEKNKNLRTEIAETEKDLAEIGLNKPIKWN